MENLSRILAEHPFMKGLETKYIELLVGCASNVRFDPEAFVFREGEEANQFFLIRQGRIALAIHSETHGPIIIQTLEKGDILGWSWLAPPYYRHLDAQALELTRVIAFDGKCLRTKCQEDKNLGYELLMRMVPVMGNRLEATRLKLIDVFKASH
jgi:CRP/FNR family cyclic AMP-dependent transcriptional regulator